MDNNSETKKVSIGRNALNYGVMLGGAMVVLSVLLYVFDLMDQGFTQYLSYILIIAALIMGILNYKKKINGGFISYGQSLGTGVLIGLFSSIIVSIYTIILFKLIDPGLIDILLRKAEERMIDKNPSMTDEQIEIAMSYTRKFMNPFWMAAFGIVGSTFISFLASLIISIFTKKKDNSFESNFKDVV